MKKLLGLVAVLAVGLSSCSVQTEFVPASVQERIPSMSSATDYYAVSEKGTTIFLSSGQRGANLADNVTAKFGSVVCFNDLHSFINEGKCKRGIVKRL